MCPLVAQISQPKPLQPVKNGALNSERGVQMKKLLLASVALAALGIGAPAIAAEYAVRPVAAAPAFSWTGCHLGGLVGYEWGRSDGVTTTASSTVVALPTATAAQQAFNGATVAAVIVATLVRAALTPSRHRPHGVPLQHFPSGSAIRGMVRRISGRSFECHAFHARGRLFLRVSRGKFFDG